MIVPRPGLALRTAPRHGKPEYSILILTIRYLMLKPLYVDFLLEVAGNLHWLSLPAKEWDVIMIGYKWVEYPNQAPPEDRGFDLDDEPDTEGWGEGWTP